MTDAPRFSGGLEARPADSLLVERARDFLAGGPADAVALVRRVCQLPGLSREVAQKVAVELLAPHREFVCDVDGTWRLAARPPAPGEVGVRGAPPRHVPTFDEWRAARAAAAPAAADGRAAGASAGDAEGRERPPDGAPDDGAELAPGHRAAARRAAPRREPGRTTAQAEGPGDEDRLDRLSYVVVDVETTGGTPQTGHRITEIAAVVVAGGEVREVYETLVNPQRPIPPAIMRLTGITHEMVRDKPAFGAVCPDVVRALSGHVFVAHNVGFDWRFVSHEVERASGTVLEGRRLCTVRLARKLLPQLRSRSLGYVADWYGADAFAQRYFEGRHGGARPWRHSAAGDAVATAHCLLRLLDDAAEHGVTTWGALDRWLAGGTASARRRRRSALPTSVDRDGAA